MQASIIQKPVTNKCFRQNIGELYCLRHSILKTSLNLDLDFTGWKKKKHQEKKFVSQKETLCYFPLVTNFIVDVVSCFFFLQIAVRLKYLICDDEINKIQLSTCSVYRLLCVSSIPELLGLTLMIHKSARFSSVGNLDWTS